MKTARDLVVALRPAPGRTPVPAFRQGVVEAVTAGPPASVSLRLGGPAGTLIPGVRYLAGYTPAPADTVWAVVQGTDVWIVGRLA